MAGYRRGYDWGGGYGPPHGFSHPGAPRHGAYDRQFGYRRPRTGGYREGYPGGWGGTPVRATRGHRGRDDWSPWWTGGPDRGRETSGYDEAYREFDERHHPRYSPVGGNYHAMGGSYLHGRVPRPLREGQWFSDWTRWF